MPSNDVESTWLFELEKKNPGYSRARASKLLNHQLSQSALRIFFSSKALRIWQDLRLLFPKVNALDPGFPAQTIRVKKEEKMWQLMSER